MTSANHDHDGHSAHSSEQESSGGRFSLNRLSAAFARLTAGGDDATSTENIAQNFREVDDLSACEDNGVVSPRMILEGMLFVGTSSGRPLTNREMAAHIRDVSPKEVDALIGELNEQYATAGTPYQIVSEGAGYKVQLRPEYEATQRRFRGRVREAKLTPQAIEVLSIVAYRQPITAEQVGKLRAMNAKLVEKTLELEQQLEVLRLQMATKPGGPQTK